MKIYEVLAVIKPGEVWVTDTTRIYLNDTGDVIIKDIDYMNNLDINVLGRLTVLNLKSEYRLEE